MFCFRLRAPLSIDEYINLDVRDFRVPFNAKELVVSSEDSSNIRGANVLIFKVRGYETYNEALAAACNLRDCLRLAFLDIGLGADLVDREPEEQTTEEDKIWVRKQFEISEDTELRDNRNLDVYEEASEVKHLRSGPRVRKLYDGEVFKDRIQVYIKKGKKLNVKEASAFNLFSLSKMQQNEDMIKYLLNYLAIESLVERESREDTIIEDIRRAIETSNNDNSYSEESKRAIRASLENAMQETINQAFSRLLKPIISQLFNDVTDADALIRELSRVRNKFVHEGKIICTQERLSYLIEVLSQVLRQLILSVETPI